VFNSIKCFETSQWIFPIYSKYNFLFYKFFFSKQLQLFMNMFYDLAFNIFNVYFLAVFFPLCFPSGPQNKASQPGIRICAFIRLPLACACCLILLILFPFLLVNRLKNVLKGNRHK
jgi:hypothetical protein